MSEEQKIKDEQSAIGLLAAIALGLLVGLPLYFAIGNSAEVEMRRAEQQLQAAHFSIALMVCSLTWSSRQM